MTVQNLEANVGPVARGKLFGREVTFEYSERWIVRTVFILRIVMGWVFFQGGIVKVLNPNWTATGFLTNTPDGNPFTAFWLNIAGNPTIDFLNAWGLTLVGLALLLGVAVRFAAFWGAVMMLFYWAASLTGGLFQGLPLAHGWVFDDHIVYALILFGLGAFGAGRILGLDKRIEESRLVDLYPWLKLGLG